MEDNIMKLVSLDIVKLYDSYDYSVKFNSDVTFIFGTNGCGKTTVLNITENIITGQLYKLFSYSFEKIVLRYSKTGNSKKVYKIQVRCLEGELEIEFDSKSHSLFQEEFRDEVRNSSYDRENREISRLYNSKYPFLIDIKDTFNYVYLPLNRSTGYHDYDEHEMYMIRKMRMSNSRGFIAMHTPDVRDSAMMQVEALISSHFSQINANINKINDEFRNEILKSSLEVGKHNSGSDSVGSTNVEELRTTKESYIKMLKELKLLNKSEEDKYRAFFDLFIKDFTTHQQNEDSGMQIDLFLNIQEVLKVQKLITIAEEKEGEKAQIRQPIEMFLEIMNDFIYDENERKEIDIDPYGNVYFKTKNSDKPISIHYLSSGEKQLITFFANLIFKVKRNTPGIFVVDEPELSLHLSWQKIFVEKTMFVNNNIQLIFATHSPEIIGNQTDKTYKLVKKYINKGDSKDE